MCNYELHIDEEERDMESIRHRVGVQAPITEVYDAVATPAGVARWWTRDTSGETGPGSRIEVRFGGPEPAATMELAELTPVNRVVWRCVQGPTEWLDSTITFDLRADGDETVVVFTHAGWSEPIEFLHHCSTSWAYYLISLKRALEGGNATPWPENEHISTWG